MSAPATTRGAGAWLAAALVVAALATVAATVVVMGTPGAQREARLDERRVRDLGRIADAIDRYHQIHGALPASLAALNDQPGVDLAIVDPESAAPYGYEMAGGRRYRLCAVFHTDSAARHATEWAHAAGNHCFDRAVKPRRESGAAID